MNHLPVRWEEHSTLDGEDGWEGFVCPRCKCPESLLNDRDCFYPINYREENRHLRFLLGECTTLILDLAKYGTRHDLNPTICIDNAKDEKDFLFKLESFYVDYLKSMDDYVRNKAIELHKKLSDLPEIK